jgi:hypothetical protein
VAEVVHECPDSRKLGPNRNQGYSNEKRLVNERAKRKSGAASLQLCEKFNKQESFAAARYGAIPSSIPPRANCPIP